MTDTKTQSDSQQEVIDNQSPPQQQQPPLVQENQRQVSPTPSPPSPQPLWLQYPPPPPGVAMTHHITYTTSPYHQYPNHHHYHHSSGNNNDEASNGENKTIWVGDLQHWMDEKYLMSSFASVGQIVTTKVIRNKYTGLPEGYGFVEFVSHDIAEKALKELNGTIMLNTDKPLRMNWASSSGSGTGEKQPENNGPEDLSIFVGDLAADVSVAMLHDTFAEKYKSVKSAKVVIDAFTGRSKAYGFVIFGDDNERTKAVTEMQGVKLYGRAMRIGPATPKKTTAYQQQGGYMSNVALSRPDGDSLNTTIYVGRLDSSVSEEVLRQPFSVYGELVSVKIHDHKGCGFVQFVSRPNAEEALEKLNGTVIGKKTVRLSWGRIPSNQQPRDTYGNQLVGPYFGGQYYNGYGYMVRQPHDPRMYVAAPYGGYQPMYGGHRQ